MSDEEKIVAASSLKDAIFGSWDGQKRKPGLLERVGRIERVLYFSCVILVARALGVPTDIFGKFFGNPAALGLGVQHFVAFLAAIPK